MSQTNSVVRVMKALCWGVLLIGYAASVLAQQPAVSAISAGKKAVVPPLVSYSGVLTDADNKPRSGVVGVTFALYKESQGGIPLWLETQNIYPDKTGHYTISLGVTSSTGLPADIFIAGEARWLGVQAEGQAEQPRVLLLSVPYALKAGDAETVGGLPASAFVVAAQPTTSGTSASSPRATAAQQPMAVGTTPVTTAGGTINNVPKFDAAADITNSQIFDNGTNVGIGTASPAAKLDVKGTAAVRGLFTLPATGTATATKGANSQPQAFSASVFNSGTSAAVSQNFRWQAEPVGNNTSTPSGTLNLLFGAGTTVPAETGLKIAANGKITFAAGQKFPGTGTITGITAGTGLTGGGTGGVVTVNLDTGKVPLLASANTFNANQTINGNVSITATGTSLNLSGGSTGVLATGSILGVYGTSPSGYGVSGVSSSGYGVYGASTSAYGVVGSSSGSGSGVYGKNTNTSTAGGVGVYGSTSSDAGFGVYGYGSESGVGVEGYSDLGTGVYAGSGSVGLYASGVSYAGMFGGDVWISGYLYKGGGGFKIDHPLDPANKYLYHSFVESPDMKNIYDGTVILDETGEAWVSLPEWCEAINRDFRYQLTAIGTPGPNLYIAQEIKDNRFLIAGGTPAARVSWQVTGIRQDAYAKAHPIIPEEQKIGSEKGKYLHPVEHGQPKEMGIDESRRAKMHLPVSHLLEPPKEQMEDRR